jgi:hypothetical protein
VVAVSVLRQVLELLLDAAPAERQQQAFALLLAGVAPERQQKVLRAAIAELLAEVCAPPRVPARRSRPAASPDSRWTELRPRLRALLAQGHSPQTVADGIGIAPSTLRRLLSKVQREPSPALIARATAFLANPAADSSTTLPADRLSQEQAAKLAFLAQHDRGICRDTHITRAQLEAAVAGERLDPAIVTRLTGLLAGGETTGSEGAGRLLTEARLAAEGVRSADQP